MSDWVDRQAAARGTQLRHFGEDVLLPGGASAVGLVIWPGLSAGPLVASEVGLAMRIGDQDNPSVSLWQADALSLNEGDAVTVRGQDYLIARKHRADGSGMVSLDLMPADASAPAAGSRYR